VNAGHARSVHGVMVRGAEDLLAEPVTDEAASSFEAFFTSEQTRLLQGVYLLTGNVQEAEEIVQDTLLRSGSDGIACGRWTNRSATSTGQP